MKLIVDENLLSFKVLEQKYSIMFVNFIARLPSRFWKPMIQSLQKVAIKALSGKRETKNLYQNGIWRSRVQESCISYKNGTGRKRLMSIC